MRVGKNPTVRAYFMNYNPTDADLKKLLDKLLKSLDKGVVENPKEVLANIKDMDSEGRQPDDMWYNCGPDFN